MVIIYLTTTTASEFNMRLLLYNYVQRDEIWQQKWQLHDYQMVVT